MITDAENSKHIIADEGKIFQRISDGFIYGNEMFLGYAYMIGGVALDEPLLELPEHFVEIDDPELVEESQVLNDIDYPTLKL